MARSKSAVEELEDDGKDPFADDAEETTKTEEKTVVENKPKGLYAKMNAAQISMSGLEKRGKVKANYTFEYVTEETMYEAIREKLLSLGIAIFVSVTRQWQINDLLHGAEGTIKFVDTETGDSEVVSWQGQGSDKGDKALNKAQTAGVRTLLLKQFLVVSEVDPEQEHVPAAENKYAAPSESVTNNSGSNGYAKTGGYAGRSGGYSGKG